MPHRNRAILVVDDEPATRALLSAIFTQEGHTVRAAEDGFEALKLIRESMPDILLSDLNMPGMSGFELLSVVRRLYPSLYVLASSGAYSGEAVPDGIAADAFYAKASGLKHLLSLVDAELNASLESARSQVPVWLNPGEKLPVEDLYVLMSCPNCLRVFPRLCGQPDTQVVVTGCPSCGEQISYVILSPDSGKPFAAISSIATETNRWNAKVESPPSHPRSHALPPAELLPSGDK